MIEFLKPAYNAALNPIAKICIRLGLSPNAITLFGVALSCVSAYFVASGSWIIASVIISISACMDGLDGLVARQTAKTSAFGAVLDSCCDRVTEFAWFLGICIYFLHSSHFSPMAVICCFCAMASSFMVSYIRARCEGMHIQCSRGLLQRPERIIIIVFCLLCGPIVMTIGLVLLSALGLVTSCQRVAIARNAKPNQ